MAGEQNLGKLLKEMSPQLNQGQYVFITSSDINLIERRDSICEFKEKEGVTFVVRQNKADELGLQYDFVTSWITLQVHSSLEAVGLTAAISSALTMVEISCNVIAGYYHDHLFVHEKDSRKTMETLAALSKDYESFL